MDINVLCHSSIRIESERKVIYFDPFKIKEEKHDADIIAITHSHYDHFSEEDIDKVRNEKTKILITEDLLDRTLKLGFKIDDVTVVKPNNLYSVLDIKIETILAYNINKEFHLKDNNWVGYLITLENKIVYVAGDTDVTEENKSIECDIALVPVGGTYTMTYKEAAQLINVIKPKMVIPMHYGEIVGEKQDGMFFANLINDSIEVDVQII